MKRRKIEEKVSKKFLISLLEPYLPTTKMNEKITDLHIETNLDDYVFTYVVMKGGERDKELC